MGELTADRKAKIEPGYTEEELYNLFCKFHNQRGALQILSDLMGYANKEYARETFECFMKRKAGRLNENKWR